MNLRLPSRTTAFLLGIVLFGAASLGSDCDGDIVNDPTFRDWCGDTLCDWTLDVGQIAQAPTWNADDLGVSFLDMPTQISQVTSESSATCILFTAVANTALTADLYLELDFDNDGTIDYSQPITGQWTEAQIEITAPADYSGITYHVRKNGTGTAVLAEMRVQSTTGCTAPPVTLGHLLLGEGCTEGSECVSGTCSTLNDWGVGVCALCSSGEMCTSGVCEDGLYQFSQCNPGNRTRSNGSPCVTDSDCESGRCEGASVIDTFTAPDGGTLADAATYGPSACRIAANDGGLFSPDCPAGYGVVNGGTCN
jgi:hypothetical protein